MTGSDGPVDSTIRRSARKAQSLAGRAANRIASALSDSPAANDPAAGDVEQLRREVELLRGELDRLRFAAGWQEPGHYYSPVPTLEDACAAARSASGSLPGIDLNRDGQLALAAELGTLAVDQPFTDNARDGLRYRLQNDFYAFDDGLVLHTMLRRFRPERVVEIGSGWSSACMLDTDELFLGGSTQFTFVDPEPERLDSLLTGTEVPPRVRVVRRRLQDVDDDVFDELSNGDFLIIDSSHVVKAGSDVLQLCLDVIPSLPPGVLVHIHDIGWPFEYPPQWAEERRWWTEAYLLRALLVDNARLRIRWFHSYLVHTAGAELRSSIPGIVGNGMSLWLEVMDVPPRS
jgi:Methyltransferase domain